MSRVGSGIRRPQAYQRKRAITACQLCRTRRTKCDNLRPSCSACLKLGAECVTDGADYSTFDPASLQILQRLGVLETLVRSLSLTNSGASCEEEQDRPTEPTIEKVYGPTPPPLEELLQLPMFDGMSNLTSGPSTTGTNVMTQVFDSETPWQAGLQTQSTAILADEPQEMHKLVDRYFEYVHVKNPVLSERLVRQAVSSVAFNGIDWSSHSCLALLICALGSISGPFGEDSPSPGTPAYTRSLVYFTAAQKRLGPMLFSEDTFSAQCIFLAGVYAMTMFKPRQAIRFFLQALLISEQLLLRCDADDPDLVQSKYSSQALPIRQAIHWSSWKSAVELDAALGSSNHVKLGVAGQSPYPSFYPTPPLSNVPQDGHRGGEQWQELSWYFYLAEISLKRLLARICVEFNNLKDQSSSHKQLLTDWSAQVPLWEHELREWINSLPDILCFTAPTIEDGICRFVLRGHVLNIYEAIYWPVTSLVFSDFSTSISGPESGILQLLQKGMAYHNEQIYINQPGFRHRHHGTFFMIRACARSSLALIAYAKLEASARVLGSHTFIQMPSGWWEGIQSVLDAMQYWAAEFPAFAGQRLILMNALSSFESVTDVQ
ncbi:hypothetical protein G7054_g14946 [Neopestalotiopsis clavispora]|nr:hypothetical protein G7054_g14946 [Neopestalotiopsis clavispora]